MDDRHAQPAHGLGHAAGVGEDPRLVFERSENTCPGVEDLHGLRPGRDLGAQVGDRRVRQLLHEQGEGLGVVLHERAQGREIPGLAPLHHVAGQGEGQAREADERDLARELSAQDADGVHDEAQGLLRVGHAQGRHGGAVPHPRPQHRALLLQELQRHAHGFDRDEDVREQDGRVDAQALDGLQGDLGGELRRLAHGQEVVPAPHLHVFREIAARLAHNPHRDGVDGLSAACLQEPVVHLILRGT